MATRTRHPQLALALRHRPGRGGARPGSGPKPKGDRAGVSHHGRAVVTSRFPVHVTLRTLDHVWNLRSQRSLRVIESALEGMLDWRDFRVVQYSVQGNHLHLIVEAHDNRALAEGMQGLSVRLAKGLNLMMGRHGKVLADRYHSHVLRSPSEVRRALAYVLLNHRSHTARRGERVERGGAVDPFSSAEVFDGWRGVGAVAEPRVTARPHTWLLATGWRRHGLISRDEVPAIRS